MAGRFGFVEYQCVQAFLEMRKHASQSVWENAKAAWNGEAMHWDTATKEAMGRNAGFFPVTDSLLDRFAERMLQDSAQLDVIGIWGTMKAERAFYTSYCQSAKWTDLPNLEPYFHAEPWSMALEGKKVLVIHPFEASIQQNYQHRKVLFPFPILPDFELKTLKAVQSIAHKKTGFATWFDALDHMCEQIDTISYDLAIIGAGAYGLPLAAHMKRSGKQAVHLGGATQILFGIRGRRWDTHPIISSFFNAHWTRPSEKETPEGFAKIENGCYW